jgi:hypothetical protein
MNQKIIITKVNNGYICKWKEESDNEEGYFIDNQIVFEINSDKDERLAELECMQKLFEFLQEHFGVFYDKYKENINIVIKEKK